MSLLKTTIHCTVKRDDDDVDEQLATWNKMINIQYVEMYRQYTMKVNSICCDNGKMLFLAFSVLIARLFVCLCCNLPRICNSNNIQWIKYTQT